MSTLENEIDKIYASAASFSECGKYRYELWRKWKYGAGYCMFIGLNPSTADETKNDPTVTRCINFARDWGFGALCMTNLFAWRDTDPKDMKKAKEPVGSENDSTLIELSKEAGIVIAAWGRHGKHLNRAEKVISQIPRLHCLAINKDGTPKHPLYVKRDTQPILLNG